MVFGIEYDFFSKRIDDNLSREIKYMVWDNILSDYSEKQIMDALSDVLKNNPKTAPTAAEYEKIILQREIEKKKELSPTQMIFRSFNTKLLSVSPIDTDKTREIHNAFIEKVKKFIINYRENEHVHNAFKKREDVLELVQLKDNLIAQGFPVSENILDEVIG